MECLVHAFTCASVKVGGLSKLVALGGRILCLLFKRLCISDFTALYKLLYLLTYLLLYGRLRIHRRLRGCHYAVQPHNAQSMCAHGVVITQQHAQAEIILHN